MVFTQVLSAAIFVGIVIFMPVMAFAFIRNTTIAKGTKVLNLQLQIDECQAWLRSCIVAVYFLSVLAFFMSGHILDGSPSFQVFVELWPLSFGLLGLSAYSVYIFFILRDKKKKLAMLTQRYG